MKKKFLFISIVRNVVHVYLTQLIFADVHELFCRDEPGLRAPPHVRLLLSARPERLEGGVVDELGLLNHLDVEVDSLLIAFENVSPVEKMVIVDDPAREVRLEI